VIDHSCSNPQARRTRNRRKTKARIRQSPEWKAAVKAWVVGKKCEWCGSPDNILPHHPYQDTPNEIYGDLDLSGCIPVCESCHFMYERRHKQRCPVCKTNWMPLKGVEMCWSCDMKAHPEKLKRIEEQKETQRAMDKLCRDIRNAKNRAAKRKHPCRSRTVSGRCQLSKINSQCQYSPTKALKECGDAVAKKVRV
jgi:hypothetical protein